MFMCLLCFLLSACTLSQDQFPEETEVFPKQEEERTDIGESVSASDIHSDKEAGGKGPKVLVGRSGYLPKEQKQVYVLREEDETVFYVVNADTKETVYTGTIRSMNGDSGRNDDLGRGDFSEVQEEGNYYIEVPSLGRSYTFEIKESYLEDIHDDLMSVIEQEAEAQQDTFLFRAQTLSWMLRYQEYYGEEDGVINPADVPELLFSAQELGNALIEEKKELAETMDTAEEAFYCAAMAQLYDAIKPYDVRTANGYLREAEMAYTQVDRKKNEADFDTAWQFYAAASLYKATGYAKYHNVVKIFLQQRGERSLFADGVSEEQILSDEAYIYGVVAYMTTAKSVDVNLCGALMEELIGSIRIIAEEYSSNDYSCVSSDLRGRILAGRLYMISVAEHVIVSREYVRILEAGIHYIDGGNETGESLISEEGILDPGRDQEGSGVALSGAYLFIMKEVMESEAE
ncbi:MAG: glycoside hydrolase family 9 protein [Lachnospiraceae bacterium]|nr:glycoside hydrolase family 9 protein [Lachnospiraceae bacterium]